jgi:hypothetical protein
VSWRDNLPPPQEIHYTDWPRQIGPDDYTRAASEVVDIVEATATGASVYQLGGVRTPGISDLDFAIVLSDLEIDRTLKNLDSRLSSMSPASRYVLEAKPLIIDASLWRWLPVLEESADLRHLSGPRLPTAARSTAPDDLAHVFGAIERRLFLTNKEPRSLLKGSIHVRRAIKKLSKIELQANLLRGFGVQRSEWTEFADDVAGLRRDWFNLQKPTQTASLYELLVEMEEIDSDMNVEFSGVMARRGMVFAPHSPSDRDVIGIFDNTMIFVRDYSTERRLDRFAESYRMGGHILSMLPANFLLPIIIYSHLSRQLRAILEGRVAVLGEPLDTGQLDVPQSITERIKALEKFTDYTRRHQCRWALLFNLWHAPRALPGGAGRSWKSVEGRTKTMEDVAIEVWRRELEQTRPRLAALYSPWLLRLALILRNAINALAPRRSLRRHLVARSVRTLLSPLVGARTKS